MAKASDFRTLMNTTPSLYANPMLNILVAILEETEERLANLEAKTPKL